jgi:PAS domain S-box-containing protein
MNPLEMPESPYSPWLWVALVSWVVAAGCGWVLWRRLLESRRAMQQARSLAAELEKQLEALIRFQTLFESAPVPLLVLSSQGRLLAANRAACELHGGDLVRLSADHGGVPPDMMEALPSELERLQAGTGATVETLRMGAGDRMMSVELRGVAVDFGGEKAVLVHEMDVTPLKRQAAALKEGQERYRALVGALSEGVLLVDPQGRVASANQAAERITGLTGQAIVGIDLLTAELERVRLDGSALSADESPVAQTLRSGDGVRDAVMGMKFPGGNFRWLSVTTTAMRRGLTGKPTSVVVSFTDITQQVEAERDLRRAKEAAESANQAKTEFLAHISHEIRTPLNGLTASHDLLLNSTLTEEQRGCVQTAVQLVEDLLTLLNDLLDLARIEAGRLEIVPEPFEFRPMLEASVRPFRPRIRKSGMDLVLQVDERLPVWVQGDPHRLRQVLANLVSNAVKFTPSGAVSVTLEPVGTDRVLFVVADSGIGIAPDKLSLIFEAFRQADSSISRKFGGTGLGLAICRQLVGLMQGRIWVESELGRGSRFFVEVPLQAGTPPDGGNGVSLPAASTAPLEIPLRPSARILIVEDHPVNRQLTETMVQKLGLGTAVASNGREAVERLEKESFAMVLMDVQMPEVDGLTATRRWREREKELGRPRTLIVALTAHALPQDKAACLNSGMDDYMCKPLRREALAEMLTRHLSTRTSPRSAIVTGVPAAYRSSGESTTILKRTVSGLTPTMLQMLRDSNREGLDRVRTGIAAGDAAEVARALHFLKGGCALLQDAELTASLKTLELEAKAGRLVEVSRRLPELEQQMESVMRRAESASGA